MFTQRTRVAMDPDQPPQLLVVVDTEEEFDWNAAPDRSATAIRSLGAVERAQEICERYGLVPCYVVDYAVVSQPDGNGALRRLHREGRCEIGAHLHPWVNPPFDEPLSRFNTYPGNLPGDLERRKMEVLRDAIEDAFGEPPRAYKAGRYGLGPRSEACLEALGFEVDLSCCPPFDARADGGPDYRRFDADPFWFGRERELLEIPVTGAFVGWARGLAPRVHPLAQRLGRLHVPGILARSRAIDRLMLSPEGFTPAEHQRVTRALYERGSRVFTWSFHSPSLEPGHTPYVRREADLSAFLDSFERFFDFFFGVLGGEATTPSRLRARLEAVS